MEYKLKSRNKVILYGQLFFDKGSNNSILDEITFSTNGDRKIGYTLWKEVIETPISYCVQKVT